MNLVDRLMTAVDEEGTAAGLAFHCRYQPAGGAGGRVMPPTYPPSGTSKMPVYLFESRWTPDGERRAVILDQVPSQANRVEQALLLAQRTSRVALPMFELTVPTSVKTIRLTSLDFPHRYADAYLRDSEIDGVAFPETEVGKELRTADSTDVRPLYRREPYSLLYGAWDARRKGLKPRFARVYTSEFFALDPVTGAKYGGRVDPNNLVGQAKRGSGETDWNFAPSAEKVKGERLSEIGHGHIAPNPAHGGVTVGEVHRRGWLSFAGLRRLNFGDASPEAARLARATLAALAVAGDRLAFDAPSVELRSGCDLTRLEETVGFEVDGGAVDPLQVSAGEAIAAFDELRRRAAEAGVVMDSDVIPVGPSKPLAAAVSFAVTQAAAESGE